MGRFLDDRLINQDQSKYEAMCSSGNSKRISWLYGLMSPVTNSYLAYGAYRSEVILRETAIVGVIGGTGLGWQIIESLSSWLVASKSPF